MCVHVPQSEPLNADSFEFLLLFGSFVQSAEAGEGETKPAEEGEAKAEEGEKPKEEGQAAAAEAEPKTEGEWMD